MEIIESASEIERKDLKREFDNFIYNPCLATKKIFYRRIFAMQEILKIKVKKYVFFPSKLLFFT
tara:strand:+ start:22 stop:213 length:192 start_codon:yes stop_codon:yes gene_type:complete